MLYTEKCRVCVAHNKFKILRKILKKGGSGGGPLRPSRHAGPPAAAPGSAVTEDDEPRTSARRESGPGLDHQCPWRSP